MIATLTLTKIHHKKLRKELYGLIKGLRRFIRRRIMALIHGAKYVSAGKLFPVMSATKLRRYNGKTIYWLGSFPPWQRNLGDQAQTYATRLFLDRYFPDYRIIKYERDKIADKTLNAISNNIKVSDFVLIASNGDFGDFYVDNENAMSHVRRNIARSLRNTKKIYLSSTVYYKDNSSQNKWIKVDRNLFSQPGDYLLCREKKSQQLLNDIGMNGILFPDIVFFMKPDRVRVNTNKDRHALIVLRDVEHESALSRHDHQQVLEVTERAGYMVCFKDVHNLRYSLYECMHEKYFASIHEMYQNYALVITDRMHSMIFAALNGIPCIAISNGIPHKIPAYHDWLRQGTVFIDTIEGLPSALEKAAALTPEPVDFSSEFDSFRSRFVDDF